MLRMGWTISVGCHLGSDHGEMGKAVVARREKRMVEREYVSCSMNEIENRHPRPLTLNVLGT